MPQATKLVSFRLSAESFEKLRALGGRSGMSSGGVAREAVIAKLSEAAVTGAQVEDLWKEVRTLRAELALATEAVLSVLASNEEAQRRASAWVRNNLNR